MGMGIQNSFLVLLCPFAVFKLICAYFVEDVVDHLTGTQNSFLVLLFPFAVLNSSVRTLWKTLCVTYLQIRDRLVNSLARSSIEDLLSFLPGLTRALSDEICPKSSPLFAFLLSHATSHVDFRYQLAWAVNVCSEDHAHGHVYRRLLERIISVVTAECGKW